MLQKILLAIGDSPDSARVFASGLTLAEKLGAELHFARSHRLTLKLLMRNIQFMNCPYFQMQMWEITCRN
jgi:hypothetical protein